MGFASCKTADALVRSLIAVSFVIVLNDSYIGPPKDVSRQMLMGNMRPPNAGGSPITGFREHAKN